jgi:hypothetical protein
LPWTSLRVWGKVDASNRVTDKTFRELTPTFGTILMCTP